MYFCGGGEGGRSYRRTTMGIQEPILVLAVLRLTTAYKQQFSLPRPERGTLWHPLVGAHTRVGESTSLEDKDNWYRMGNFKYIYTLKTIDTGG